MNRIYNNFLAWLGLFNRQRVRNRQGFSEKNPKRALVISGGGAKGAWGAGVVEYLCQVQHRDYDIYVGTSVGAIICSFASVGGFIRLKYIFNSFSPSDVFKDNPFTKNGRIKIRNIFETILLNKKSLGDSSLLRETIKRSFTKDDFEKLRKAHKELVVCVTNLTDETVEAKSSQKYDYDDFCNWLYISCCEPVFMEPVLRNGKLYADGGIKDYLPIQQALDNGATELDVILLVPASLHDKRWNPKNVIDIGLRTEQIIYETIADQQLEIAKLSAEEKGLQINVYRIPFEVANSLDFNKELMEKWWKQGFKYAST